MGVTVESPVHSLVNLGYHQAPLPTSRLIGSDMRHYMRPPLVPESVPIAKQSPNPKREEKEEEEEEKVITVLPVMEVVENRTGGQYSYGEEEDDDDDEEEGLENWEFPEDEVVEYGVDPKDVGTVDSWIKRHPHLIRLTGRHPMNCEPPLPLLMQHGFLTPPSLHYVRNHGPVPQVPVASAPDDWIIQVTGLVRRPQSLSLRQLLHEFKPRELPVTLVCAGNRRKEQNTVKQTIGFNWGPGAIGTSVWRGARLCDVLHRCGIYSKKKGGLYVSFEGKETLPAAGGTKYGTSISVDIAMDETRDVLLAYMQNGKPLEPDHGFPVRMIIPGFIGGRMVKWLARIHVSDHESDGHYHYKDNRVLPADVDADTANAQGLWFKPEYLINELNINSVISTPSHGEFLPINAAALLAPYTVKGYAYSGGGRKVGRVEVTIDGGQTWMQCEIQRPEKPTKYGKHWCWCFWSVDIELIELMQAKELAVRAWDESMNTQPQNLTWNVMGMMNNCWFRVRLSSCRSKEGGLGLLFEHPTRPGNQTGGWMMSASSDDKKSGGLKAAKPTITKSSSSPFLGQNVRQITMAEVKKHSTPESPWIVVNNKVYDCKKFLKEHPGGMDSILISAGTDCTEEFEAIHSDKAKLLIEDFYIGELASYGSCVSANSSPDNSVHGGMSIDRSSSSSSLAMFPISEVSPSPPIALNPKQRIDCTLIEKRVVSKDTRIFRFALPSPDQILGLPVGKHIFVSAKVDGKLCMRAYTPIKSSEEEVGYFELLVKIYYKDSHPQFPQGGAMSQHLDSLKLGDSIGVKGPIGHIEYKGRGHVHIEGKPKFMKRCSMIAGGTGITPIYQFIKAILKDPDDATEMHLVYANRTEDDILLREELDMWARDYPGRFSVWYVIGKASREDWGYSEGHITEEILRNNLSPGDVETMAFMCGPPPMIQFACLPNLDKLGYHKNMCFQF